MHPPSPSPLPILLLLALLPSPSSAFPFPFPSNKRPPSQHFPNIHTLSTIGDSYAAGLGAGPRLDFWCSRHSDSYPSVLFQALSAQKQEDAAAVPFDDVGYPSLQSPPHGADTVSGSETVRDLTHHSHACTGATMADMRTSQLPQIPDGSTDVMTISAGANDIGWTAVLNACVYQFYHDSASQETDCRYAIHESRRKMEGMGERVRRLLEVARGKMNVSTTKTNTTSPDPSESAFQWNLWTRRKSSKRRGGPNPIIYLTLYTPFFAPTTTTSLSETQTCTNTTLSLWAQQPSKQYLTPTLRTSLNALISDMNRILEDAVIEANEAFADVDVAVVRWGDKVGRNRGRFCEDGVEEPEPGREGLAFFEWGSGADEEEGRWRDRAEGDLVPVRSFEGEIAEWVLRTLRRHSDWSIAEVGVGKKAGGYGGDGEEGKEKERREMVDAEVTRRRRRRSDAAARSSEPLDLELDLSLDVTSDPSPRPDDFLSDVIWWLLPDGFRHIFHPRPHTHVLIAELILQDLQRRETDHTRELYYNSASVFLLQVGALVMSVLVLVFVGVAVVRLVRSLWRCGRRVGGTGKGKYAAIEGEDKQREGETEPLVRKDEAARVDAFEGMAYDTFV
ncbi:uncharacterized protein EI97DRAFT_435717 [Westerdykella ornata]|uniref:SGNH hydrolase n=1 Tax=Westerdykella ornata TaxID=318751 RepID=A0A6A6JDT0_WESOR|nr:uncharacterized protein EI97DRAFT_435717 [Westerdykella ornata]KAF2273796.1 hypothetical protein EI97DRAFT_435717 [Westerdykella ornata]